MKKIYTILITLSLILLSSCILFQNINQPSKSLPNDIVIVSLHTTTEGTAYEIHAPFFGICLPIGWTIPGDSIQCNGVYNELIYYDDSLSIAQNGISPAPTGYYWWVGNGLAVSTVSGNIYAVLSIQTDNQIGLFSIDYMIGDSYNGVNQQRSDNHQIEIVDDDYCPRRLQVSVEGNSVFLNWAEPLNTSGLIGYNIYRDEVQINTGIVADTIYYDANPVEGIHSYTIASYYTGGNEYMMPYDKSVVYQSVYISPNGSNANNGSSFNDALQTIDYAMSVIRADSLYPITIFLAPGYYSPYTNEEQYPITCLNYVSIIGSGKDVTILSAEDQGTVLQFVNVKDNAIDGLAVTFGSGGVYCSSSGTSFSNVNVTSNNGVGIEFENSNSSLENISVTNNGGSGISSDSSDLNLIGVTIIDNSGSGISCNKSTLDLHNVTISGNNGRGIICNESNPSLENVTIINNNDGGLNCLNSTVDFLNGDIINNTTENSGGGIESTESDLSLVNVNIINNSAATDGGGISTNHSIVHLNNVLIKNNTANNSGGGIICLQNSVLNFDSTNLCKVYFNHAIHGNDLYSDSLQIVVVDKFTALNPTRFHAFPIENFTFNISQGMIIQVEADLFVSSEGDNSNSGLTENDPLKTINYALSKILVDSLHPHTINLLEGIYSHSSNGEFFPINIFDYVNISGESDSSVILDAEELNNVIRIYGNKETLISDLTIRGGSAPLYGGGIYCSDNSSPKLENVIITDNSAYQGGGIFCDNSNPTLENVMIENNSCWPDGGGGIFCGNTSNLVLVDVTVTNNGGVRGGGIYISNSNASLTYVTIANNSASNSGGGMYCSEIDSLSLSRVTIANNSANKDGGGLYLKDSYNISLDSVNIINNSALRDGGGIYLLDSYNISLENVTITDNTAALGQYYIGGGGMFCWNISNLSINNVIITNNHSEGYGGGGGIYCAFSNPSLENTIIANNSAGKFGGGILCNFSNPNAINVTITNNSAVQLGGGIFGNDTYPNLKNCIHWNNSPEKIFMGESSEVTISYSDIQGGQNGIIGSVSWLEGNIDNNPLLVVTGNNPYLLSSGSPCIDAGNPDTTYNDPEDPNNPGYALWPAMGTVRNDMGAYGGPNAAPFNIIVGIEDDEIEELRTPTEFELAQNYPNPFNPSTTIRYSIKERSPVELILYDILGREVKVLVNEVQDAGYYKIKFNAGRLASGIYFYRIQAGSFIETKKMVLMK